MADILKEFLVKLGFKIDEEGQKKFKEGVAAATKEVTELGLKAVGASTAVAGAITHIAEQYEELYFASIRTGASAAALTTFAYGSKAIGISAEQSASSLERLNVELLANPGKQMLLNMMGIETAGRSTKEIYNSLIETLDKMPKELAFRYGAQFGMSPTEIIQRTKLRKQEAEAEADYARRLRDSGLDVDELAHKSEAFGYATHQLSSTIGMVWDQTANKWLPTMTDAIHQLNSWAELATRAGSATSGWSSTILSLVTSLGALKVAALFLPKWIGEKLGFGGGASLIGSTAARIAGPLGVLLGSTEEANKGEVDLERPRDPKEYAKFIQRMRARRAGLAVHDENDFPSVGGNLQGMDQKLVDGISHLNAAMKAAGIEGVKVGSGFRTYQEQAALYVSKPGLAAPPGHSHHEHGLAADLERERGGSLSPAQIEYMRAHASEFGLGIPMGELRPGHKYEPWHVEPLGTDTGRHADSGATNSSNVTVHNNVVLNGVKDGKEAADRLDNMYREAHRNGQYHFF